MRCHVCHSENLKIFENSCNLNYVSSDVKPLGPICKILCCHDCGVAQKIIDLAWRDLVSDIYRDYRIFSPRISRTVSVNTDKDEGFGYLGSYSERLLSILNAKMSKKNGQFLDFGCGDGTLLRDINRAFPAWRLAGAELNSKNEAEVLGIPGVEDFYSGHVINISKKYDVINLSHVLEHIVDPVCVLKELSGKLNSKGVIVVSVPNSLNSIFDFIVADHSSHFSVESLERIANFAGLHVEYISNKAIEKEIVAIFSNHHDALCPPRAVERENILDFKKRIDELEALSFITKKASAAFDGVGIFGSSIAACWVAQTIGNKPIFFVDENSVRVGNDLMGSPIIAMADIPENANIIFPFRQDFLKAILSRLNSIKINPIVLHGL